MGNEETTQTEIKKLIPTVGRVVYYKSRGSLDGKYPPTIFASIITRVLDENTVSLIAFSEIGFRFEQDVKRGEEYGQWDWIPYTKKQAGQ